MTKTSTERANRAHKNARIREFERRELEAREAALQKWSPEQRAELERHASDHRYFMESCLWVADIDGGKVVPMTLNPGQEILSAAIEEERAKGDGVRIACLKSRKQGISTFCQALGYQFTSTRERVNGLVVAHVKEKTANILELSKAFYMLDERKALGMRPLLERSAGGLVRFGNPDVRTRELNPGLQSSLEITSAESKEPGRSGTYHFVHASEAAFWPEEEGGKSGQWVAIGNALMEAADTFAIVESTARGAAGFFYELCEGAMEGTNGYRFVFLSWLIDPRCRRRLTHDEIRTWEWRSKAERDYAERHKLTLEQAKFRRLTIADPKMRKPGRTPESVFDEEYPATPELAFQTSAKLYFLASTLQALRESKERGERLPAFRGHIKNRTSLEARGPHNPKHPIEIVLDEDPSGPLRVWEKPRTDCEYIVAADIAEGLVHGDNHSIDVLRRDNLEFVASWVCNDVTSRTAGQIACLLGWWYGSQQQPALVGIELNAHGIAAAQEAVRILYPHLWHHTDVRKEGSTPQDRVGWLTTEAVRPYMLDSFESEIQLGTVAIHDREFYVEANTFENVNGKPQARIGKKDDRILSKAIALQLHMHAGPPRKKPKVETGPVRRALVPDWPEQGKVPMNQNPGRLRRVKVDGLWGGG